jgi:hypothetical protein
MARVSYGLPTGLLDWTTIMNVPNAEVATVEAQYKAAGATVVVTPKCRRANIEDCGYVCVVHSDR